VENTLSNQPTLQLRIGNQSTSQQSKRCKNCKQNGHVKANCWFLTKQCDKCGKKGHSANVCHRGGANTNQNSGSNKRSNDNSQSGSSESKRQHTQEQAHVVIEEVPMIMTTSATENDLEFCVDYGDNDNDDVVSFYNWLVDSCMTSHICNSRDSFATYEDLADATVRSVGNITTKVLGRGTVRLRSHVNDKTYVLILQDVLHVPSSQYSLLSLSKWDKSCGNFLVDHGCLTLAKHDGKVVAQGQRLRSNLYKMCLHVQHKYTHDLDPAHRNTACSADAPQSWET
jgi:hypothetical protein